MKHINMASTRPAWNTVLNLVSSFKKQINAGDVIKPYRELVSALCCCCAVFSSKLMLLANRLTLLHVQDDISKR